MAARVSWKDALARGWVRPEDVPEGATPRGASSKRGRSQGWRTIGDLDNGGQRVFFRSTWEANVARYLEWQRLRGMITRWSFETTTFRFPYRKGTVEYKLDFDVTALDGSLSYHEVKGWMDRKSATRLDRLRRHYPNAKLVLVDAAAYRTIARQMNGLLPDWE